MPKKGAGGVGGGTAPPICKTSRKMGTCRFLLNFARFCENMSFPLLPFLSICCIYSFLSFPWLLIGSFPFRFLFVLIPSFLSVFLTSFLPVMSAFIISFFLSLFLYVFRSFFVSFFLHFLLSFCVCFFPALFLYLVLSLFLSFLFWFFR